MIYDMNEESNMSGGSRILVIDDDPALLRLTTQSLLEYGYEVVTARNGQEGLKAVFEERPALCRRRGLDEGGRALLYNFAE